MSVTLLSIPLWDIACLRPVSIYTLSRPTPRFQRSGRRTESSHLHFHSSRSSNSLLSSSLNAGHLFKPLLITHRFGSREYPILTSPSHPTITTTMPRLEDNQVYDEEDDLLNRNRRRVVRLWEDFVGFAFQGNVLEIAFGLM